MILKLFCLFVMLSAFKSRPVFSLNILFTAPFISHQKGMSPVILAMINAGHNVSVFFTDVSHHSMAGVVDFSANLSMSEIAPLPYVYYLALTKAWPIQWAIATFTHHRHKLADVLNQNFDLLIQDSYHDPLSLVVSEKYNLPLAIISSFAPVSGVSNPNYFGLQYYPSYNGRFDYVSFDLSNRFATRLGRVVSFLPHKLLVLIWNNLIAQCAKDFWGSVGSVANVESNSLAIITTYPIELDLRTPLNHQVHYIPLTCDKIKGNADMSQLLNGSHKGIVLVSYGHQWKWSDFVTNEFFAAFEKFPQYKIIWQRNFAEDKNNVPDNVQLVDWIPQTALLGTAKVKIFISHGGPKSLTEGICAGVPMLVCPSMKSLLRFTDVPLNAEIIESLGIGLSMTNRNFDRETLAAMIGQLLVDNTKFRRKISSLRSAWIDKPIRSNEVYKFNLERVRRRRDQMKLLWEKGKTFPFWNFFPMDIILTFLLLPFITLSIIVHSFLYL